MTGISRDRWKQDEESLVIFLVLFNVTMVGVLVLVSLWQAVS